MSAPRDVDELASALLDGLLDREQAAAARQDPEVASRVAEMAAVRASLRQVPAPDPRRREEAIAAALDVAAAVLPPAGHVGPGGFGAAGDPGGAGGLDDHAAQHTHAHAGPGAPDADEAAGMARVPLRPAPARHGSTPPHAAGRHRRVDHRWLAAAAAIVAVVALGSFLATLASPRQDDASSEATAASAEASAGDAEASTTAPGGPQGPVAGEGDDGTRVDSGATDAPSGAGSAARDQAVDVDLGAVRSVEELADRAAAAIAGTEGGDSFGGGMPPPEDRATSSCGDPLAGLVDVGPLVLHGRAVLGDRPVEVWVHGDGSSPRLLATDTACGVVVDQFIAR